MSRRAKVAKHDGIYYRDDANGKRRYEVDCYDSEGRRRWQTVPGTLKEAEAARDELRRQRRKGERIAPARAPRFAGVRGRAAREDEDEGFRSRTFEKHDDNLRLHVKPRLGRLKVSEVREEDVAALVRAMEAQGYSGATIKGALVPLSGILVAVVRKGWLGSNPVSRLDRSERPKVKRKVMRVLDTDEIGRLLDASPERYRPLLATAAFGGLRTARARVGGRRLRGRVAPRAAAVRPGEPAGGVEDGPFGSFCDADPGARGDAAGASARVAILR